jgi:alkylation response protein AidB-like acyl-CoA dehydrogenase
MHRVEMLNGSKEEFITDVRIPDSDRIGEVDQGRTVGTRWMFYEKSFSLSLNVTRPATSDSGPDGGSDADRVLIEKARRLGRLDDPATRDMIGEAHSLSLVSAEANRRNAISTGKMSEHGAGLGKVLGGTAGIRIGTLSFQLAGPWAAAWTAESNPLGDRGVAFLTRQASVIGGGTVEMSRDVVSERLLGMPREPTNDRDVAFRDVPRAAPSK